MKISTPGVALLAVCCLGWCPALLRPAAAQGTQRIEGPAGIPVNDKLVGGVDNPRKVWLAADQVVLRVKPDETSEPTGKSLGYLELAYYTMEDQHDHLLLAKVVGSKVELLGWVAKRYLIQAGREDQATALQDPATKIYYKGLIVNSTKAAGEGLDLSQVSFRKNPFGKGGAVDNLGALYNIFFIYAKADGHVLLGKSPFFSFGTSPEELQKPHNLRNVILGWLPESRVCEWKTREGFQWDRDSTLVGASPRRSWPGRIFATPELAQRAARAGTLVEYMEIPYLFEEPLKDGVSPVEPHDAPRFPILEVLEKEENMKCGRLLKVGGIGGLGKVLTKKELDEINTELSEWRQRETVVEILLVIDDTDSMEKWFQIVGDELEKILIELRKDPKRKVRLAVAYYNDITPGNLKPVETAELKDALEAAGIIEALKKHKVHDGGDAHEMVFRGLCETIDAAKFSPHARKLVLVIGDCGDIHHSPNRMEADPRYAPSYNPETIVDRLIPVGQTPIEFYAIHATRLNGEAERDYETDMRAIMEEYQKRLVKVKKEGNADFFPSARVDKANEQIKAQFDHLLAQAEKRRKAIELLRAGKWKQAEPSKDLVDRYNKLLQEKSRGKVTFEDLKKLGAGQLFEEGYVWEKSPGTGAAQINKRLFLKEDEVLKVVQFLSKLEEVDPDKKLTLAGAASEVIQGSAGNLVPANLEPDQRRRKAGQFSLADCFKMSHGLKFKTGFLVRKLDDLEKENTPQDQQLNQRDVSEILNRRDILKDVLANKRQEYEVFQEDQAGVKVPRYRKKGEPKDDQRLHFLPFDEQVQWVWLDYEREWP